MPCKISDRSFCEIVKLTPFGLARHIKLSFLKLFLSFCISLKQIKSIIGNLVFFNSKQVENGHARQTSNFIKKYIHMEE